MVDVSNYPTHKQTYEPIATTILNTDSTSVTFGGGGTIPQTYTSLSVVITGRRNNTSTPNSYPYMIVNSDTGTNYSSTHAYGYNTATYSSRYSNATGFQFHVSGLPRSDEALSVFTIDLINYQNASVYKTFLSTMSCPVINSTNYLVGNSVGLWRSTSAITSITLESGGASWHTGSKFSLYGIAG